MSKIKERYIAKITAPCADLEFESMANDGVSDALTKYLEEEAVKAGLDIAKPENSQKD